MIACDCASNKRKKDSPEEVQGATTSSHIPPPLSQDLWPCIQLLRAERHSSETWSLTKMNVQCLHHNDKTMIRQIRSIKPEDVATGQGKVK